MRVLWIGFVAFLGLAVPLYGACPKGDINGDCVVDIEDLFELSMAWLGDDAACDLDGSGRVDLVDLGLLASDWQKVGTEGIVINEILAHSHDAAPDWVELYNPTSRAVDIGGWFLSDSDSTDADLMKYEIAAGTKIPAYGYLLLRQDLHFGNSSDPGCHESFAFSENGEEVCLSSGRNGKLTGYRVKEKFGASATSVSFGRHYRQSSDSCVFVLMSSITPARVNSAPLVGPIVFSEVMYHPAGNSLGEYVELTNISSQPVALFDQESGLPWRFEDESGFVFTFPVSPVIMQSGEKILLVRDINAAGAYNIPAGTKVFSWADAGALSNSGEEMTLYRPGDVDKAGQRHYIVVDQLDYKDDVPWPNEADGEGKSLVRQVLSDFGDDWANWLAGNPSPGI